MTELAISLQDFHPHPVWTCEICLRTRNRANLQPWAKRPSSFSGPSPPQLGSQEEVSDTHKTSLAVNQLTFPCSSVMCFSTNHVGSYSLTTFGYQASCKTRQREGSSKELPCAKSRFPRRQCACAVIINNVIIPSTKWLPLRLSCQVPLPRSYALPLRDFVVVFCTDVGSIYKRLFNHRPVLQNEVHYFVHEFEVGLTQCHVIIQAGNFTVTHSYTGETRRE